MKQIFIISILLLSLNLLMSETIFLNDGQKFIGDIIGKEDMTLYLNTENETLLFKRADIKRIILKHGKTLKERLVFSEPDFINNEKIIGTPKLVTSVQIKYNRPNIYMLPLSLLSFTLMWDYICQIQDINDSIKDFDEIGLKTNELKKDRTRKAICCVTFGCCGLLNTIYSFEKIEIKASPNSILLSYKF